MKNRKWRKWGIFLIAGLLALPLSGCSKGLFSREIVFTTGLSSKEVFKIDGMSCSVAEAKLLLLNVKNQYEEAFGPDIWEQRIEGILFEDYAKDMVKNQLAQLKCMVLYAQEEGIALTEEELEKLKKAAEAYYKSLTEEGAQTLGVALEDVEKVYEDYAIANRLYEELTKNVDKEISDAEAKVIVVQHIFRDTGNMSLEAKNQVYQEMLGLYGRLLEEGADFVSLAEEYSDDSRIEYTFGKGEMESAFEETAFSLAVGEISTVTETSSGYHIIKCVNDYDVEKTNTNKTTILEKRKRKAFDSVYGEFVKGLLSEFNENAWEAIHMEDIGIEGGRNLYEVYEEYMEED